MKVVVTDAEFPDLDLEAAILEDAGFTLERADCRTADEVAAAARGATALLVQYAPITAEVVADLDELRVVSRYGVGVDSVDVDAATRRGVWVANVPDYGTEEVAAHTVALLLSVVRHLPFQDRIVRGGVWDFAATGPIRRLRTMTLGLLGLGRIGRVVAERAGPWFERVLAFDPYLPGDLWPDTVERASRDDVVRSSHVLSLHMPLTGDTRAVIDRDLLALAPEVGVYLVNTARGALVAMDDLLVALDEGRVLGVALDVLPEEPPSPDDRILRHPRVTISPHMAWYSQESERDLRRLAALNIVDWVRTGQPRTPVNRPVTRDEAGALHGPAGGSCRMRADAIEEGR